MSLRVLEYKCPRIFAGSIQRHTRRKSALLFTHFAPVVQWIELRTSKPLIGVQFLAGAPEQNSSAFGGLFLWWRVAPTKRFAFFLIHFLAETSFRVLGKRIYIVLALYERH